MGHAVSIATILGVLIAMITAISQAINWSSKKIEKFNLRILKIEENITLLTAEQLNSKREIKEWIKDFFEGYYYPLDDRIKNLNKRLKEVEKQ